MKKFFALALSVMMVLAFAACGNKPVENPDTPDTKVLTMSTNAEFPPYEYFGEDGKVTGIDAEIAAAIAEKMGYELKIEHMDFTAVLAAIATGKADFAMAGLTITPDRQEQVDFSTPYTTAVQAVIVKEDSPIKTVDDLFGDKFYTVGVQTGFTGDMFVTSDIAEPKDGDGNALKPLGTVERYKKGADSIQALLSGKVDCVVIDDAVAKNFVDANPGLKILETKYAEEQYALAVPKGESELSKTILATLDELIQDGTVQKIIDKYITA